MSIPRTIALFSSSRRHGNTGALIDCVAGQLGIEVVDLGAARISVYDYEHRNRDDDFEPLMQRALACDQLIFASPVYWYAPSPAMKIFLDRISDFLDLPDLLADGRRLRGKQAYVVCTSIEAEASAHFIGAFVDTFNYLGMHYGGVLHADCRDGYVATRHAAEAVAFAKRLQGAGGARVNGQDNGVDMSRYELAQLNVGVIKGPMDSPVMADFAANLERINELAERSSGFVWRLQTEDGDATAIRPFGNANMLVNMSVWKDVESLSRYVYNSEHVQIMRRRREWFERMDEAFLVLWWVPEGHRPGVEEALARLQWLRANGPGPEAFTFRTAPLPPDALPGTPELNLGNECPAT